MTEELPQEVTDKILDDLTDARNMDDIVADVCEEADLDWKRAETLVNDLSVENEDRITLSQSPLLVSMALITFVSGVALLMYTFYEFYRVYSADSRTFLFEMLFLGMNGQIIFWAFLLGVGMVVGSLRGMRDVWRAVFSWLLRD